MVTFDLLHDVVDEQNRVEYEKKGVKCISVEAVKTFLNENKGEDVQFNISSLGGNLGAALTIGALIKAHSGKTIGNIIGLTASAGTVIADSCDETIMSNSALFLVHNGWKEITGNVYDFQKAASDLAKSDALMVKLYREKTKLPDSKIVDIMKASDWLSPSEALNYGFVDRVYDSNMKIAASVLLSEAQGKINTELLTKLQDKMNLFGKAKKPEIVNVLALKEAGKQLLINAEAPAQGVEVAPLGAMQLEDGEYELADGRKIVVAGGVITEVKEREMAADSAAAETDAIVAAVMAVVSPVMAEIDSLKATLANIKSTHTPVKGAGPANPGQASVKPVDVTARIEEITNGIREEIVKSRKA